jgi:hypothetical protein
MIVSPATSPTRQLSGLVAELEMWQARHHGAHFNLD